MENNNVFEPITLESVSDAVVSQIEKLILSGVLKGGQKLPSEKQLSEMLQVSRPSVRDAARILEQRGLVTVKHGDGTFIANLTGSALSQPLIDLFSRHGSTYHDYLDFRHQFEGFAAYMAAKRRTESDLEIINHYLSAMEKELVDTSFDEEPYLDAYFHSSVVEAAHNTVLTHITSSIYELMGKGVFYNRIFMERELGIRETLLEQHKEIVRAIEDQDADRACDAAQNHVEYIMAWHHIGAEKETRDNSSIKRLSLLDQADEMLAAQRQAANPPPKRKRGRPRKNPVAE